MFDDVMPSMGHSTFTHVLIDLDISSTLPREIVLMFGDRPWTQSFDYKGLSFRCQRYFSTGHLASDCSLSHHKGATTWWKDANVDHLTINASYFDYIGSSKGDDVFSPNEVVPLTTVDTFVNPLITTIVTSSIPKAPTPIDHVLHL